MDSKQQASLDHTIRFDQTVFDLITIKKAAYRYLDVFAVDIVLEAPQIICSLKFPASIDPARATYLVDEFRKEVLDQDLRERIRVETESIRKLILAHAFSNTGIADHERIPGA
jgi:His-Xaa-Ser system protein HxsD